jgi:hypothetical protein
MPRKGKSKSKGSAVSSGAGSASDQQRLAELMFGGGSSSAASAADSSSASSFEAFFGSLGAEIGGFSEEGLAMILPHLSAAVTNQKFPAEGGAALDKAMLADAAKWIFDPRPNIQLQGVILLRQILSRTSPPPPLDESSKIAGLIPKLVLLARSKQREMVVQSLWCLTNLCSGDEAIVARVVEGGVIGLVADLLMAKKSDREVIDSVAWLCANISGDGAVNRDLLLDAGVLPLLLPWTDPQRADGELLKNTTWCLANMLRFKPTPPWEKVLPLMHAMKQTLNTSDGLVLADALRILHFFTGESKENELPSLADRIQLVLDLGILPRIITLMTHPLAPAVRAASSRLVGDFAQSSLDSHSRALIEGGVLPVLKGQLGAKEVDMRKEGATQCKQRYARSMG